MRDKESGSIEQYKSPTGFSEHILDGITSPLKKRIGCMKNFVLHSFFSNSHRLEDSSPISYCGELSVSIFFFYQIDDGLLCSDGAEVSPLKQLS